MLDDVDALRPWLGRLLKLDLIKSVGTTKATSYFVDPMRSYLANDVELLQGIMASAASPSYSPKLGKKAMDVAESRNLIHDSVCETES
jgi:hypothetical protein